MAKIMDLSKCGGICRGACKHYAIGVECPPEATYEPVEVGTASLSLDGIKEWMAETEGKGGIARRDHTNWLIAEAEKLHSLMVERDRYKAEAETAYRSGLLKAAEITDEWVGCDLLAAEIRKAAEEVRG